MKLEGKVVVVTGGEGFIGSHLVDRLIKENPEEITVFSNLLLGNIKNLEDSISYPVIVHQADLSSRDDVFRFFRYTEKPDVIFNLAVTGLLQSLEDPELVVKKNIDMTLNLCEAQRLGMFRTLVQFSSSEAYGTSIESPMSEDHPVNPTTPYGASKLATDYIALSYQNAFGLDTSVVRPFNAYGPRQNAGDYAGLIPLTINRVLDGGPLYINGGGEQRRDYVYVADIADATVRICENEKTRRKVINIGSGSDVSINQVVDIIAKEMNYSGQIIHREERQGEVKRLIADIGLAKSLIGYYPSVSFEEGIKSTIDWYKKKGGSK